jgi:hypothetical protein
MLPVRCTVRCPMDGFRCAWMRLQHPCALAGEQCGGALQSLKEEEWQLVQSRCAVDKQPVYKSVVICKRHANRWLHRWQPTRCAACLQPLSSSAAMPCPEWLRERLGAAHGAVVHVRPCYKEAVAARKQAAPNKQPMKVETENTPPAPSFQIDVSLHHTCRCGSRSLARCSPALSACV